MKFEEKTTPKTDLETNFVIFHTQHNLYQLPE